MQFETYFDWLCNQVEYFDGPKHRNLLGYFHEITYVPIISRDENRENDGKHLRNEYFTDLAMSPSENIYDTACSFLEFLVALAHRMNYIYARVDEDRTKDLFWLVLKNAGIDIESDVVDQRIADIVDRIIYRKYDEDGYGGLFPLDEPRENQRNVEVWYQMNQYLIEIIRKEGRD